MDFFDSVQNESENSVSKPILKWVGGKQRIVPVIIPKYINKDMLDGGNSYFEPFLGSGAIAFHCGFDKMIIGDKNKKLINFYNVVRDEPNKFCRKLEGYIKDYEKCCNRKEQEVYYYERREDFNSITTHKYSKIKSAALFWFLNKTGFNGMYREDKKGNYNIPFGQRNCPSANMKTFGRVSEILQKATLLSGDFEMICGTAKTGDLVYLDPPYIPLSNTASFSTYLKGGFGPEEQKRLRRMMKKLSTDGVRVVASNSDCESTHEIYGKLKDFRIEKIKVRRLVSGKNEGRKVINEVIITNVK